MIQIGDKMRLSISSHEETRGRQKVSDLKAYYEPMETEFARMRAQLDIVHLIFGR